MCEIRQHNGRLFGLTSSLLLACACSGVITSITGEPRGAPAGPETADGREGGTPARRDAAAPAAALDGGAPSVAPYVDAGRVVIDAGKVDDGGPIGDPSGVLATPASTFLNSIGVCTHVAQGVDNPTKTADAMLYAGIRNFRDDGRPQAVPAWIDMHRRTGVRGCILSNQDLASTLDIAVQMEAAGALIAIEGPNEPNNFPVTYKGQSSGRDTTFMPVAQLQKDLYAAVKAAPALASIPVFHSSEAGGSEPNNVGLQFLTIPLGANTLMPDGTQYADYANVHNYVCGHRNELVDNLAWNASDPTLDGDWDSIYVEYGLTWNKKFMGYSRDALPGLPRVTTETGWTTKGATGSISEVQQAHVFLDLYLSAFKRGFSYTFIYMLHDDPIQGYWGLFDVDYAPKLSGEYLHNFTTQLADTATRPPGKLDYSLETQANTVHDLLLQKSEGTFELVVWDERFAGGSDEVTVHLGVAREVVSIFDPTKSTAAERVLQNATSVVLTLSDHPLVIELRPPSTAP